MKKNTGLLLFASLLSVSFPLTYLDSKENSYNQVYAANINTNVNIPESTKVNLYKLQADSFNQEIMNGNGIKNLDGQKLSEQELAALGNNVKGLSGVTFEWFKITDGANKDELSKMSREQLEAKYNSHGDLTATNDQGLSEWTVSKENYGKYWVIEKQAPKEVSESYAVPFEISLPASSSNGTGYLSELNIYPKNVTANVPAPGKDVEELGNNDYGSTVGTNVSWYLKGTIPTNIDKYTKYQINDTLSTNLSFGSDNPVEYVKVGDNNLIYNTEYTVNIQNQKLEVSLTKAGIAKIAQLVPQDKRNKVNAASIADVNSNTNIAPFIEVKVSTKINSTAVMGKEIPNSITITYNNTPGINVDKDTSPSDKPEVHTSGKKFVKIDATTKDKLSGAEFKLLNSDKKTPVVWTEEMIKANQSSINNGKFVGNPTIGENVILKSNNNGEFEIKGLSYGNRGENSQHSATKYVLEEIKAPEGYVLPAEDHKYIEFTVNETSYNLTPTTINVDKGDAASQEVNNNKRPEIPLTGGIGSLIFIITGTFLVGLAGLKLSKKEKFN